jgi:transposase InsO family protein
MWQIDLVDFTKLGYEKYNSGFVFILQVIDNYSKFLWNFPLKNKSGDLVAYTLQKLFMNEGSPSILASDNGSEFRNPEMSELCSRFNIDQRHGQPYKSNTQGSAVSNASTVPSDQVYLTIYKRMILKCGQIISQCSFILTTPLNTHQPNFHPSWYTEAEGN